MDPVQTLIDEADAVAPMASRPTKEGMAALQRICEANDQRPPAKRVRRDKVVEMLREHYGWKGRSEHAFNRLCKELGRRSFSQP